MPGTCFAGLLSSFGVIFSCYVSFLPFGMRMFTLCHCLMDVCDMFCDFF